MSDTQHTTLLHQITDNGEGYDDKQQCKIQVCSNWIEIGFEGYGNAAMAEGHGFPVAFELYEGKLRLLVWSDINEEDPTHIIELNGAQEARRT